MTEQEEKIYKGVINLLHNEPPCDFYDYDEKGTRKILTPYKEEPEIDWSKVPKDTKVLVSIDGIIWNRRYFCECKNGEFWCYDNGKTSWSCPDTTSWPYCILAEDEEWNGK